MNNRSLWMVPRHQDYVVDNVHERKRLFTVYNCWVGNYKQARYFVCSMFCIGVVLHSLEVVPRRRLVIC